MLSADSRASAKEGTGISLLDDATDDSDSNAVTRITASPGALVDPGEHLPLLHAVALDAGHAVAGH